MDHSNNILHLERQGDCRLYVHSSSVDRVIAFDMRYNSRGSSAVSSSQGPRASDEYTAAGMRITASAIRTLQHRQPQHLIPIGIGEC